jgi:hypothetical protein
MKSKVRMGSIHSVGKQLLGGQVPARQGNMERNAETLLSCHLLANVGEICRHAGHHPFAGEERPIRGTRTARYHPWEGSPASIDWPM